MNKSIKKLEALEEQANKLRNNLYEAWKSEEYGTVKSDRLRKLLVKTKVRYERRYKNVIDRIYEIRRKKIAYEEDMKICESNWI